MSEEQTTLSEALRRSAFNHRSAGCGREEARRPGVARHIRVAAIPTLAERGLPDERAVGDGRDRPLRRRRVGAQAYPAHPQLARGEPAPASRLRLGMPPRDWFRHSAHAAQRHLAEAQIQGTEAEGDRRDGGHCEGEGTYPRATRRSRRAGLRPGRTRESRVRFRPAAIPVRAGVGYEADAQGRRREGEDRHAQTRLDDDVARTSVSRRVEADEAGEGCETPGGSPQQSSRPKDGGGEDSGLR